MSLKLPLNGQGLALREGTFLKIFGCGDRLALGIGIFQAVKQNTERKGGEKVCPMMR
jgi:hypothetical protein